MSPVPHQVFSYHSVREIQEKAEALHISLPFAEDTGALLRPAEFHGVSLPNRMGTAPMEGADSEADGSPSALTERRYLREAAGGSAVIWFEAVSIVPEGRSSAHQLYIHPGNVDAFRRMNDRLREEGLRKNGFAPYLIMQANHSGRYSNPFGRPAPLIAYRNPIYEKLRPADDTCIVSDAYLKSLEEKFGEAALLAREAGFDAVDVKACHGYLLMELLSAYTRPGEYGGSFENRSRLLLNALRAARAHETREFRVTARIGIHDGFPWPCGFGVKEGGNAAPDWTEAKLLLQEIRGLGLEMVNLTMGNPYVNSHVSRPFNHGKYVPDEDPLVGVARMIHGIREVKEAVPGMFVYASGPSFMRQFCDLFAAGAVEQGFCDGMLFGRMAFADPDFANQILRTGRIDPKQVCVACGKCGDLIRAGKPTGCVVRDSAVYLPPYREYLAELAEKQAQEGKA